MFFIHPMWDSETQRIGMKKCTPSGYTLRAYGELVGGLGLLLLLLTFGFWVWQFLAGNFVSSLFWIVTIPLGLGVFSEILVWAGWRKAQKRGFQYDYRIASWLENGERRFYQYESGDD